VVTAANGLPLREFSDAQGVWRYPKQLNQVSPEYIEVLLNYEDRYFYQHIGINPFSLLRAAWQWVDNGRVISGGSTITMQVARLIRPTDRTVWGKVRQILTALQLEWNFDKSQILTYYINHAPFGGRIEGVEAASLFYFGYSAKHLTYAQAALLAVLPQSPSKNRPDRHPKKAERARNKVLKRMLDYRVITSDDYQYSLMENVEVIEQKMPVLAPLLSRKLAQSSNSDVIQTSINYDKQLAATDSVKTYVQGLGDKVTAAVLVVDNQSSEVIVYVGSADFYDNNRFAHIDMVQAQRSPGSTLKPFIYGMALDKGIIHSHSLLMDVPLKFEQYRPENFNDNFSGPVTAQFALASSLNVPAVQLLEQLSPNQFFVHMLNSGVALTLPKWAKPNLSIALGGLSTNLETLVKAYMALSNQGHTKPLRYTPKPDTEQENITAKQLPILSPSAAWVVSEMLKSTSSNQMINELSRLGYAVKTGTSASHSDVLAIGSNRKYTIGVWIGRPDNGSMSGHQGSFTAAPLLYQMVGILEPSTHINADFIAKPDSVESRSICWPAGNEQTTQCLQSHNARPNHT
jgi:penicillin-binding protein 1C